MRVALVCIAKNEDNYIDEWINYHLKLGFDNVIIYLNDWTYHSTNANVKTIQFDGPVKQVPAYNNFLESNQENYDWAAFFDVDEFLVLKKHNNIKEMLLDYSDYNAIGINWVFFGSNGLNDVQNKNFSVLSRFTKRAINVDQHVKTICKVKKEIKFGSPHSINLGWSTLDREIKYGPFNRTANDNIAQLNHYFCKTKPEFEEKISRGRADANFKRKSEEYIHYDLNEIEDLCALNFYIK